MLTPDETDPIFADLFGLNEKENRSHDLCQEIDAAAGVGNAAQITKLLNDYEQHYDQHNDCVMRVLLGNTFRSSCENGYVECAKILMPFVDENHIFHALLATAKNGHTQVLEFLLPLYKWANAYTKKAVLCNAALSPSVAAFKTVLPYVPSKTHRTEALREACKANNQAIFDLLYPLSNPQSALKYMEQRKTVTEEEKQMLKDAITAEQQKKVLTQAVGDTNNRSTRALKI